VAALVLFVAIAGPLVAVTQSQLRKLAEDRADEAERAGYEATTQTLAADQALVQSYLSQAQNLRNAASPGRQGRALGLLQRASGLKRVADGLVAKLGADPAGWRAAMARFWHEQEPGLRSEAAHWLAESSLKLVADRWFPVPIRSPSGVIHRVMTSRSGLAVSEDSKWLAYFRVGLEGADARAIKFVEIIEADTGKVVHTWKVGPHNGSGSMNALAFDPRAAEFVLLARVERDAQFRPAYLIERWSRVVAKVVGQVSMSPLSVAGGPGLSPWPGSRLVLSADRASLLSVPGAGPGPPDLPATVWDLATARLLRTFEKDFAAEAFFPDGRRVIGTAGSEIVVRDVVTGGVAQRWPMPEGLISIQGNLKRNWRQFSLLPHVDAQSLWVSPDGKWVAAVGQPSTGGMASFFMLPGTPTTIFLFEAESGRIRSRIPIAVHGTVTGFDFVPVLAFDAEGRSLAVLTTRELSLFSVPDGTPLVSQTLPESDTAPAGQPSPMGMDPARAMPTGLHFARGSSRLFSAAYPSNQQGFPAAMGYGLNIDPRSAAKPVEQVVRSWDVSLPRVRTENHPHEGPVRSLALEPRDRFLVAAGDDRMIRVGSRRGPALVGRLSGRG
jgi:hypothetical protein